MEPVSSSPPVQDQYQVAMLRKQNDAVEEQGREAVALIDAASAPAKATSGDVGRRLHVVA